MEYPVKVVPNPRPLFYFKKRDPTYVYNQIINIINKMYPHNGVRILDIACGDSKLISYISKVRTKKQLIDEIVTIDKLDPSDPVLFTYYQIDLNNIEQFEQLTDAYRGYFDIILGMDTIEYLDNPKMYLLNLKEMLHEKGHLFISMSNINNPITRRMFYKKGKVEQFCENGVCKNIILPHVLDKIASSLYLNLVIEYPIGLYPKFWLNMNRSSLYTTFCNLLKPRLSGSWSKLYIFTRGD